MQEGLLSSSAPPSTADQAIPPNNEGQPPKPTSSGFTAVNGKDSSPPPADRGSLNGSARQSVHRDDEESIRDPQAASHEQDNQPHAKQQNGLQHATPQSSTVRQLQNATMSPGKRKRSLTDDEMNSYANSPYDISPPGRSAQSQAPPLDDRFHQLPTTERHQMPIMNGVNGTGRQYSSSRSEDQEDTDVVPGPDLRQEQERIRREDAPVDASDAQMAEALRSETREEVSQQDWAARPDEESAEQYAAYGTDRNSQSGGHQASAKRKRVFSNRTKTGCLTCRRRKKKCDENHPFCNNCKRGHFTCEGYSSRNPWQKQASTKTPVPLQAKDGYNESPEYVHHAEAPSPRGSRDSLGYEGVSAARHGAMDDGEQRSYRVSNSPGVVAHRSGGGYANRPWSRNVSYMDTAPPNNPLPPISQLTREPNKQAYPVNPYLDMGRSQSTSQQSSGSWTQYPPDYNQRPSSGSHPARNLPGVAREGLSMEEKQGSQQLKGDWEHKGRMIKGQLYEYNDPTLAEDRRVCKLALRRYHDVTDPFLTVDDKTRRQALAEIFVPQRAKYFSINTSSVSSGTPALALSDPGIPESGISITREAAIAERVRPGLVIETPFRCQYGYNIRFGDDVYIGENCSIIDACPIVIGSKTWIGQNVQLVGSSAAIELNKRAGSHQTALWVGASIIIAEDVHIGAGAIILQGVKIGRGALIKPGAVVSSSVEQYATFPG